MNRAWIAFALAGVGMTGALAQACGGSDATIGGSPDASADGTTTDGALVGDGSGTGDGASNDDGGGPACAAPSDSSKSALCVFIAPEAIQFLANDPSFDGKGFLAIDVHDTPTPDSPDGGSVPPLQAMSFPSGDAGPDAAEFDLAGPMPTVRFDNLPAGKLYPRVVFVDARGTPTGIAAGWWLGGYELANGIAAQVPLKPVSTSAGAGTSVTIDLIALRRLHVTLTRSVAPVGNAQGPATVVATPDQVPSGTSKIFGVGQNACAKMTGNLSAEVNGFVFGKGPYYAVAVLNDFGAGGGTPPGSLTSIALVDGGFANPPGTQLNYAATAYQISHTVDLDLAVPYPDAGADPVSCP